MNDLTPSQTIGPFFHDGLHWAIRQDADGVRITGKVLDAEQQPIADALLEIWQPECASAADLSGFQRVATDQHGSFSFALRRLTGTACVGHVTIFARGLLGGLHTRVYLPEAAPQIPASVPAPRRHTLVAQAGAGAPDQFRWDIRLRGDNETVFFSFDSSTP